MRPLGLRRAPRCHLTGTHRSSARARTVRILARVSRRCKARPRYWWRAPALRTSSARTDGGRRISRMITSVAHIPPTPGGMESATRHPDALRMRPWFIQNRFPALPARYNHLRTMPLATGVWPRPARNPGALRCGIDAGRRRTRRSSGIQDLLVRVSRLYAYGLQEGE